MNAAASTFGKALVLATGGLLATANLALAQQPATSGSTSLTIAAASYTVTYTCTAGPGCALGNGYEHTYNLNIDINGAITGSGTQTGYPQIQEKVNGSLAFNTTSRTQSLDYLSTYDGLWFAGYTVTESGATDLTTGTLIGTAKASMAGHPEMEAEFAVKGIRTSLTLACIRPGNSCNSNAAQNSQSWKWQPGLPGSTTTNPHANSTANTTPNATTSGGHGNGNANAYGHNHPTR